MIITLYCRRTPCHRIDPYYLDAQEGQVRIGNENSSGDSPMLTKYRSPLRITRVIPLPRTDWLDGSLRHNVIYKWVLPLSRTDWFKSFCRQPVS